MALQYGRRLNGPCIGCFGDFMPGQSDVTIELAQRGLASIGFAVPITGKYDAPTSAAVVEFRGAVGMSSVDAIDDAFLNRLWQEVDAAGNTANLPPGLKVGATEQPPVNITGKPGAAGVGFFALLLVGYLATRKKK